MTRDKHSLDLSAKYFQTKRVFCLIFKEQLSVRRWVIGHWLVFFGYCLIYQLLITLITIYILFIYPKVWSNNAVLLVIYKYHSNVTLNTNHLINKIFQNIFKYQIFQFSERCLVDWCSRSRVAVSRMDGVYNLILNILLQMMIWCSCMIQ